MIKTKRTFIITKPPTNYPDLMKEWHWEKNIDVDPKLISVWDKNKYWWKCSKGANFQFIQRRLWKHEMKIVRHNIKID